MNKASISIRATPAPRTTTYQGHNYAGLVMGQTYTIEIRNNSDHRIEATVSVDGKDVMTGEPASSKMRGMIVTANGTRTTTIEGWRTSDSAVAAFELTPRADSYAALTTGSDSIGVIGLAIFEETRPLPRRPVYRPAVGVTRGGAASPVPARATLSAGTGFGSEVESHVRSTTFNRATTSPAESHLIVYDDVDTLIEQGILPAVARTIPNPFPADTQAYCKSPGSRS